MLQSPCVYHNKTKITRQGPCSEGYKILKQIATTQVTYP